MNLAAIKESAARTFARDEAIATVTFAGVLGLAFVTVFRNGDVFETNAEGGKL